MFAPQMALIQFQILQEQNVMLEVTVRKEHYLKYLVLTKLWVWCLLVNKLLIVQLASPDGSVLLDREMQLSVQLVITVLLKEMM